MKALGRLASILLPAVIIVGGLEIVLRFAPEAVPLELLKYFHPDVQLLVAEARQLPNRSQFMIVERDDGGPILRRLRPNTTIIKDMGDAGSTPEMVTDEMGFCNPDPKSYEVEEIDVIVIGDSFTWCSTVRADQAWPARLAKISGQSLYNWGYQELGSTST